MLFGRQRFAAALIFAIPMVLQCFDRVLVYYSWNILHLGLLGDATEDMVDNLESDKGVRILNKYLCGTVSWFGR